MGTSPDRPPAGRLLEPRYLGQPGDVLWTPADWAWIGGLFDVALAGLAMGVPVVAARMAKFTPEGAADLCAGKGRATCSSRQPPCG